MTTFPPFILFLCIIYPSKNPFLHPTYIVPSPYFLGLAPIFLGSASIFHYCYDEIVGILSFLSS